MKDSKVLDSPFFTLEYREGVFVRRIPPDAEDLGDGFFRQGEKVWRLPHGEDGPPVEALAFGTVKGRALLSLINRGAHPLIISGPRLAAPGERIVELALIRENNATMENPGGGPVLMELRRQGLEAAKALEGLPQHRFYQNTVYEIIGEETLAELTAAYGAPGQPDRFILRGEDIPRFVEARPRLIYHFADPPLQKVLAEERVFIPGGELSLVLAAYRNTGRGPGRAWARPVIACRGRRYRGAEISGMLERDYILLDDMWARREDIEKTGVFPLGCYAGGAPIEDVKLTAPELIRRGGSRFAGFFAGLEADMGRWISRGDRDMVFASHLDFLYAWGFSGGLILPGHREQARFLAAWLGGLLQKLKGSGDGSARDPREDPVDSPGRALVLMERRYYDLYLAPHLPEPRLLLPGLCVAFYEDLSPREESSFWDLLVLVEPEEILLDEKGENIHAEAFARIVGINAGQRLGIFSNGGGISGGPIGTNKLNALFGIRGGEERDWLIRDIRAPLPLPAYEFPLPAIRRPPLPFGEGAPFRCTLEAKFRGLSAAALFSELAAFDAPGNEAPFVLPRVKQPDFDRMDEEERAFFFYWRRCFQNGKFAGGDVSQTDEAYIRLYARELCLFTGPEETRRPEKHYRELRRLWEIYGELFPGLKSFLPQWILDFAILYDLDPDSLSPLRHHGSPALLYDLYLHRHFIDENNLIAAADLRGLVPELSGPEDLFSSTGLSPDIRPDPRLVRNFELAVNTVDRYLREHFRLRLFSFFYPPKCVSRRFTAFAGMAGAGYSAYTAEWIHFSGHPPLLRFLGELYRYTEYWFSVKKGLDKKGRPPPLDEVWKQIVDPALGLEDQFPAKRSAWSAARPRQAGAGPEQAADSPRPVEEQSFRPRPKPVQLRLEFLDRLRVESDEVREMLLTEETLAEKNGAAGVEDPRRKPRFGTVSGPKVRQKKRGAKTANTEREKFWDGLEALEREAIGIIAKGGATRTELEAWARKNGTMADLVIDGINEKFLDLFGDLLIETMDEEPRIQSEYREELRFFQNLLF